MKNVMLDLETLSTQQRPVIVAIGLVMFDEQNITSEFYRRLHIDEQIAKGRHISDSTIRWWMRQSDRARQSTFEIENINADVLFVLRLVTEWFFHQSPNDRILVWGNGSDFDNAALMSLYHDFGLNIPWSYSDNRCYRTAKNMWHARAIDLERVGEHHNALDDARSQAIHLQRIWVASPELRNTP